MTPTFPEIPWMTGPLEWFVPDDLGDVERPDDDREDEEDD